MQTLEILFEDNYLLVINKPPGMVVNKAESVTGETVQDWVERRWQIIDPRSKIRDLKSDIFIQRAGIAHRLDKETSGCLLIAKDPETLHLLMRQFKERRIHKTYLALVHGKVEPKEGWWYWPIKRKDREKRDEFGVNAAGRLAQTNYKVVKYIKDLSLIECYPITGRTHQIRVHAAFAGHPLAADAKYGQKKSRQADLLWCPRHFLHAYRISFYHPFENREITVKADLPDDLSRALKYVVSN